MQPETLLYIGGIADGERRLTKHQKTMVAKFTGEACLIEGMRDDLEAQENYITENLYELQMFHGKRQSFPMMALSGMTPDDIIEALISKYPAPKDDD